MKNHTLKSITVIIALVICISGNIYSQSKNVSKTKSKTTIKAKNNKKSGTKKKASSKKKKSKAKKSAPKSVAKIKKVTAYVKSNNIRSMIYVTGISSDQLKHMVKFRHHTIPLKDIQRSTFITPYSPYKSRVLERQKKYSKAAAEIISGLAPALNYVKVPENNLVAPLFDAAYLYLKAASVYNDKKSPDYNKEKAQVEYAKAYRVFKKITQAKWYFGSELAKLNTIFCNIRMNKLEIAEKHFKTFDEPTLGDASYGLYWLIDGLLKIYKNKPNKALDSIVKSIVFDTKNINTFPESLLLSAYCYEDMLDNYRARDTFYEVSELFQGTPEGEIAFSSSQFIRERKLTEEAEAVGLEKIFFDSIEDVNKKVDDHIVAVLEKKRIKEEKRKKKEEKRKKKEALLKKKKDKQK